MMPEGRDVAELLKREQERSAQLETTAAAPATPSPLPVAAQPAASTSASGNIAVAGGAGLLIGVIGGVLAALAALVIGTLKVVAPLRRRLRR